LRSPHPLAQSDRRRLHDTFAALCRIPSPTGNERAVADWLTRELRDFGLEVDEDDAGAAVRANAGNLLIRIPGVAERSVLLCAHMDTVPPTAPLEPVRRDGGWENAGEGILGADNKAAVAALVETARIATRGGPPPIGIELLFTVSEETGLLGAREFDVRRLRSDFGFIFDHASPLGEVIVGSPTHARLTATIHGRAAHAGLEPELGINAILAAARALVEMPQGRIDPQTTANLGTIAGGTATNVVAATCTLASEVRSLDPSRVDALVQRSIDALQDAADGAGCDLDLGVAYLFHAYRVRTSEPGYGVAERALRAIGHAPVPRVSGGGSDANALRASGFPAINLANGTERAHQPNERVSDAALEDGLRLALAVIEEAAAG
jgi:tripeptide aminopeptidase